MAGHSPTIDALAQFVFKSPAGQLSPFDLRPILHRESGSTINACLVTFLQFWMEFFMTSPFGWAHIVRFPLAFVLFLAFGATDPLAAKCTGTDACLGIDPNQVTDDSCNGTRACNNAIKRNFCRTHEISGLDLLHDARYDAQSWVIGPMLSPGRDGRA